MSGYYQVWMDKILMGRYESADDADDYIEHHMTMFPNTPVPQREWVGVA
jgi:hypothetical protein